MLEDERDLEKDLHRVSGALPKFVDGRINYKNSNELFVLVIFVKFKEEILLLKRSDKVMNYKNLWTGLGGFIDEQKPLKSKILEELQEELAISNNAIKSIQLFNPMDIVKGDNHICHIYPGLVELHEKVNITLDWEHTEYKWINVEMINCLDLAPNTVEILELLQRIPIQA